MKKAVVVRRIRWDRVLFVESVVAFFLFVLTNLLVKLHYIG